jgi:hypothetical protein
MSKSKIDFISDLLANKKLDSSMKQKLFELTANEIKNIQGQDYRIWDEINKLKVEFEKEIKNKNGMFLSSELVHNPIKTAECLSLFKQGERLKWITHVYPNREGDVFNYNKITTNAFQEFEEIKPFLPRKVAALIVTFLTRPKPTKSKIFYLKDSYETWRSKKVTEWCKNHPGMHPDTDFEINKTIITPFKKSVEVRDGADLIEAIKHILVKNYPQQTISNLNIDFSGIKRSTRFFTGVDQLMTGISSLFSPIIKRKDISNRVNVSSKIMEYDGRYVNVLEIKHLNSNCMMEYRPGILLNGDMLTAKKEFISICDWSITANFSNGTYCVQLLDCTSSKTDQLVSEKIEGFTHRLIFY